MADRIAETIQELGVTLEAFGKPLGVSKSAVHNWVTGVTKDLRNDNLIGIEDHWGISMRWLITGKGEKYVTSICPEKYSRETIAIAEIVEGLDSSGRRSVQESAEKEKRLKDLSEIVEGVKKLAG